MWKLPVRDLKLKALVTNWNHSSYFSHSFALTCSHSHTHTHNHTLTHTSKHTWVHPRQTNVGISNSPGQPIALSSRGNLSGFGPLFAQVMPAWWSTHFLLQLVPPSSIATSDQLMVGKLPKTIFSIKVQQMIIRVKYRQALWMTRGGCLGEAVWLTLWAHEFPHSIIDKSMKLMWFCPSLISCWA